VDGALGVERRRRVRIEVVMRKRLRGRDVFIVEVVRLREIWKFEECWGTLEEMMTDYYLSP
jgi:hypothetical protein